MRRILLVVLICCSGAGVFANPFLGTWEAELVFNTDPLRLEFLDAQQVRITIREDSITQGYRWNPDESKLYSCIIWGFGVSGWTNKMPPNKMLAIL